MASSEAASMPCAELGYEAVFDEDTDRKYVCPVCLLVMRHAVQTSCGHRFCQSCIIRVANGSDFCKCPVDNYWLNLEDELFVDVAMSREILSLKVKCEQLNKGCRWTGDLRDLELHSASCGYKEVPCEYNCAMKSIPRSDLAKHMETCNLRSVSCEHCDLSTTFADLTKHQLLDCRKFPVACSLCCKTGINREDIPSHLSILSGDCPRIIMPCPYKSYGCEFTGRREIMSGHEKEAAHLHLTYMEKKVETQDIHMSIMDRKIKTLQEALMDKKAEFEDTMSQFKASQMMNYSGKQFWRVEIVPGECLYRSRSFYTGCPGYKLCVSLELDGHTESGQSYASLFVIYEKGDFDDELLFPFSALCKVSLFAHHPANTSHEAVFTCSAVPRCRAGDEPFSCQRGLLRFISMEKLLSDTHCVDNCIFMNITVDTFGTLRREWDLGNELA